MKISVRAQSNFALCHCKKDFERQFLQEHCGPTRPAPAHILSTKSHFRWCRHEKERCSFSELCAKSVCGLTRPAPAETFLCEESFTKSTQGTSWFLDLQRRGSFLTPFEPPYIGSQCARQRHSTVRSGTPVFVILPLPEQTGGENFAARSSRGDVPLGGESKEETSSLANLWFLSFREERNLGRGLSKPATFL